MFGASANNDAASAADLGAESPLSRPVPMWKMGVRPIQDLP